MLTSTFKIEDAYMLHDHLESVAAAAYQMRTGRLRFDIADTSHTALLNRLRRISDFAQSMCALELTILLKVSKAREWCERLGQREYRLTPVVPLFIGTTGLVVDKIEAAGDLGRICFHGENDTLSYLISRGFVVQGTLALDTIEAIGPSETIQLLGELPLSPLAETCRTFSDVIDTHFKLFRDEDAIGMAARNKGVAEAPVVGEGVPIENDEQDDVILVGTAEEDVKVAATDNTAHNPHGAPDDNEDATLDDVPAVPARPTLRERLANLEAKL